MPRAAKDNSTDKPMNWFDSLHAPVAADHIKQRDVKWGKGYIEYIEWHSVATILDNVLGKNWDFVINEIKLGESAAIVNASLLIYEEGSDKPVRRDGVGVGMLGNTQNAAEVAVKGAASDALKRAAVLYGVARELYTDDDAGQPEYERQVGEDEPRRGGRRPAAREDNNARSLGDMITSKQLAMIRGLAREHEFDAEEESERIMECALADLSKRGASDFIDALNDEFSRPPARQAARPAARSGRAVTPRAAVGAARRGGGGAGRGGGATEKQLNMIGAICNQLGFDPDQECQDVIGKGTNELSVAEASEFIDHLKEIEQGGV